MQVSEAKKTKWLWWALFLGCTALYSYPYLKARVLFHSWDFETTEFLYWDRQFNFSLAQTFKSFGPNFLDPYDRTYPVFYQQFLYWIFGGLARLGSIQPWAAANLLQLIFTPVLFVTLSAICGRLRLRGYGRILALFLIFVCGHLALLKQKNFGVHAIVMAFSHILLGSYSDTYGILFGAIGLYWLVRLLDGIERGVPRRQLLLTGLAFMLSAAASSLMQLLCSLHFLTLYGFVLVFWQFPAMDTRLRRLGWGLFGLISILLIATRPNLLPMPLILATGAAVFLVLLWQARHRLPHVALMGSALLVAAYLAINLSIVKHSGLNPFLYQDTVRTVDLAIPWYVLLWALMPIIPGLIGLPFLSPDLSWRRAIPWASLITAILMCFNDAFGYNNHPYRFIPMSYPFLCIASMMGWPALVAKLKEPIKLRKFVPALQVTFVILVAFAIRAQILDLKDHFHSFAQSIDSPRRELIDILESLRTPEHPHPMVYVSPEVQYVEHVAPYTGVRFYRSSFLGYGQRINTSTLDKDSSPETIINNIQTKHLPIDWVILPRPTNVDGRWYVSNRSSPRFFVLPTATADAAKLADHTVRHKLADFLDRAQSSGLRNPPPQRSDIAWYAHPTGNSPARLVLPGIPLGPDPQQLLVGLELRNDRSENGVTFRIKAGDQTVLEQSLDANGRWFTAVDLPTGRKNVDFTFEVDANDGNDAGDWAYWVNPIIITRLNNPEADQHSSSALPVTPAL